LASDLGAPQQYRANPYTGKVEAAGTQLPTRILNRDINGDGLKTKVYVKGKIWKYIMEAYVTGLPTPNVISTERLSDDVILAVSASGAFNGDVDVPTPVGETAGKDWMFRFLMAEPNATPSKYGCTDPNIPSVQSFPSANSVALAWTVWHLVEDERGKGFYMRKSWEKLPFRLMTGN
jgi:hypothetical protein